MNAVVRSLNEVVAEEMLFEIQPSKDSFGNNTVDLILYGTAGSISEIEVIELFTLGTSIEDQLTAGAICKKLYTVIEEEFTDFEAKLQGNEIWVYAIRYRKHEFTHVDIEDKRIPVLKMSPTGIYSICN